MKQTAFHLTHPGAAIAFSLTLLTVIGLACIYATEQTSDGPSINTAKQGMFTVAGIVAGLMVIRIGYQRIAINHFPSVT